MKIIFCNKKNPDFFFYFYKKNLKKLKKIKNKINYIVSMPHNQLCTVIMPLIKESYFTGLESKLFFLQGINRNSPKLQGGKYILTLDFTQCL